MILEQTLTLDLLHAEQYPVIRAKQGDESSRVLRVAITRNGEPYPVPQEVLVEFRCLKADGCSCMNPVTVNSDGTVCVTLTSQTLAAPGTAWADLCLRRADGLILSTLSFQIRVDPVPLGLDVNSDNELIRLQELIRAAEAVKSGESAYEIALRYGFDGSEEEWLASLQGVDGITPVKGVDYYTDAERQAMVSDVLAALEHWEGGSY